MAQRRSPLLPALALALAALPLAAHAPVVREQVDPVQREALFQDARGHLAARVWDLGLEPGVDFSLKNLNPDPLGGHTVRLHQTHQGVRVFEGEAIVHYNDSGVRQVTDALVRNLDLSVTPSLLEAEAAAAAHAHLAPVGPYASAPTVELVVARVETEGFRGKRAVAPRLVYLVHTELENGAEETRHTDFFVDAHSGEVLESWDSLHTAGTGNSQFSGSVSLNTSGSTGAWTLLDTARGMNFGTYDLNHGTSGTGTLYTDADNTWGDGANYGGGTTSSANGQTAAVDAHYGVGKTYDFYMNVLSRNGIDGKGTATYSRVHYSTAYDNAFWSDTCFCMTYGDGSSFKSLEAVDVAGHEMSHGVCAKSANLTYKGESGGLNEANSDIFGTMVEFMAYASGTTTVPNCDASIGSTSVYWTGTTTSTPSTAKSVPTANYLIGERLSTSKYPRPLRFMYKPSLDGASQDAWSTRTKSVDVHYSSGPANHFFFLLAHGSQADRFSDNIASPMANGVTSITGIGNDAATRIWYRALTVYMTASTNYAAARLATLNAAKDLYGATSAQYTAVAAAWKAVNVL